jgi:iron complex transport system substrate-binding protein
MRIKSKIIIFGLLLVCLLIVTVSLASETQEKITGGFRTIVDNAGNTVENVPPIKDIERIILVSPPMLGMYYTLGYDINKIVGTNSGALENGKMGIFYEMCPDASEISSDFFTSGYDVNVEEVLNRKPDLALCDFDTHGKAFRSIEGLPVLTLLDGKNTHDPFKTSEDMISIMTTILGNPEKGDKLIEYGRKALSNVRKKAATIENKDKLKAMVIHMSSDGKVDPRNKNFYSDFWFNESGLINVAGDLDSNSYVDMEQVYKWNPDIIFIYNGPTREDILENNVKGVDWSGIQAVKNKRVYTFPRGVFSWYPIGAESPLMIKWIAQTAYPDIYNYDMKQETYDFYKEFYDYELSDEQLSKILDQNN